MTAEWLKGARAPLPPQLTLSPPSQLSLYTDRRRRRIRTAFCREAYQVHKKTKTFISWSTQARASSSLLEGHPKIGPNWHAIPVRVPLTEGVKQKSRPTDGVSEKTGPRPSDPQSS
jgi:hypothetical protein